MASICALPHLEHFSYSGLAVAEARLELLRSVPRLKSVHLADVFCYPSSTVIPLVSELSSLRSLSLAHPLLYGDKFRRFCASPCAMQLTTLRIERLHCAVPVGALIPKADWCIALRSLRCLTCLHCCHWFDIDVAMPAFALAPQLLTVIVQPAVDTEQPAGESTAPSVAAIAELLSTAPKLRCVLRLTLEGSLYRRAEGVKEMQRRFERGKVTLGRVASRFRVEDPVELLRKLQ